MSLCVFFLYLQQRIVLQTPQYTENLTLCTDWIEWNLIGHYKIEDRLLSKTSVNFLDKVICDRIKSGTSLLIMHIFSYSKKNLTHYGTTPLHINLRLYTAPILCEMWLLNHSWLYKPYDSKHITLGWTLLWKQIFWETMKWLSCTPTLTIQWANNGFPNSPLRLYVFQTSSSCFPLLI